MTLFIDGAGYVDPVFDALLQICNCDPGLSVADFDNSLPGGLSHGVNYQSTQANSPSFSAKILRAIIAHPWPVTIYGVGTAYITPNGVLPIYSHGGGDFLGFLSDNSSAVWVDCEDANGKHYLVNGANSFLIHNPLPVLLFHELSHAYHWQQGDLNRSDGQAREAQAIADENAYRAQLNLPQRHPTNHMTSGPGFGAPSYGGTTFPSCGGKTEGYGKDLCQCNIATVALGSPVARQIVAFRRAKRQFERVTVGSVPLLEPMMDAYQMFSPMVAQQMRSDPALRQAMLHYGVEPAVELLRIVESYASEAQREPRVSIEVGDSFARYLASGQQAKSASSLDLAASAALAAILEIGSGKLTFPPGPTDTPATFVFGTIAANILASGVNVSGPAWMLEGLALFLRAAAVQAIHGQSDDSAIVSSIGEWLVRVPLPPSTNTDLSAIGEELRILRASLFPDRSNREEFARRLLSAWPESAAQLQAALEGADYTDSATRLDGQTRWP